MTAQAFTVFCMDGYWPAGKREVPADLLSAIEYAASEDAEYPPVAWAAEPVIAHGGTKGWAELRAESIAAGRLIEFRDGKYIPLGVKTAIHITENGVAKVKASDVLRHPEVQEQIKAVERLRDALTWATPKPVDRWEGYEVHHSALSQPAEPVHPLQRITDPSDPLHGSAFLR